MSLTSYQAAPPRVLNYVDSSRESKLKSESSRSSNSMKEALAARYCAGKIYAAAQSGAKRIQRSSVVERSAVNRLVVGSNPTAGATQALRHSFLKKRSLD